MARLIDIFPVRVGLVAAEPISNAQATFYEKLAEGFTGDVCRATPARHPPRTLSAARIQDRPELVARAVANAESEIDPDATALVLDLSVHTAANFRTNRGQYRGTVWIHLAEVIDNLLGSWRKISPDRMLITLLDQLPPAGDDFRTCLEHHMSAGRLALADVTGALIPAAASANVDESVVRTALRTSTQSDLTLLRRKLIRRLGWFAAHPAESSQRFVRYYYDCQLAQEEITRLLEQHCLQDSSARALAYDPSGCRWLQTPVKAAAEGLEIPWIDLDAGTSSADDGLEKTPVCLIVPAVETGASLLCAVQRAAELDLQVTRIVAVLSTEGPDGAMGHRRVEIEGNRFDVLYFVRIEQRSVDTDSQAAAPVQFGIGSLTYNEAALDDADELSPYEYWDLVRQVGLKAEEDVPIRSSLGSVPDFPRMLANFGTWLAHRLRLRVERSMGDNIENMLFVRPAHESGSEILSEYLELIAGARVIPIDRDVLDSYRQKHNMDPVSAREIEQRKWFLKLSSRSVPNVIFLDEFIASGGTLRDVIALGERLGFGVAAAACLADFGPGSDRPVPIQALYRVPRMNHRPSAAPAVGNPAN